MFGILHCIDSKSSFLNTYKTTLLNWATIQALSALLQSHSVTVGWVALLMVFGEACWMFVGWFLHWEPPVRIACKHSLWPDKPVFKLPGQRMCQTSRNSCGKRLLCKHVCKALPTIRHTYLGVYLVVHSYNIVKVRVKQAILLM